MQHRILKAFVVLLAAIVLASCAPPPTPVPTQPPPTAAPRATQPPPTSTQSAAMVKLLPYNYTIRDAGDGWNDGRVELAFENVSKEMITGQTFDLSGATLQTQEGKTYPATLNQVEGGVFGAQDREVRDQRVDFTLPKIIPPNWRWARYGSGKETQYVIKFRAATAANPLRIVFPKQPGWTIDLNSAKQPPPAFPAEDSILAVAKPLTALADRVLANDSGGLRVTLDGKQSLIREAVYTRLHLQYTIVNTDKLDTHKTKIKQPIVALFFSNGGISLKGDDAYRVQDVQAGPGQTKSDTFFLGYLPSDKDCLPRIYAFIEEGSQYGIYKMSGCIQQ